MHSFQLNVLGMDISFRTDADSARIERAQDFVEKQYERLKNQGGQFGREKLLTLLVLGVADDLLQTQRRGDSPRQLAGAYRENGLICWQNVPWSVRDPPIGADLTSLEIGSRARDWCACPTCREV